MKKIVVAVVGGTLLLIGLAMIVLPGPAIVVIPAGLAILATEFVWARRALRRVKEAAVRTRRSPHWPAFLRRKRKPSAHPGV